MALTACAPCNCIPGNISPEKFRQDVEIILCEILDAIQAGPIPVDLVNIPAVSLAFGSIAAVYGTTGFAVAGDLAELAVQNNTNQDVQISYDGGTSNGPIIPIGEFRQFNFLSGGGVMPATTIFIKYLNGVAPTLGQVVIDGYKRV